MLAGVLAQLPLGAHAAHVVSASLVLALDGEAEGSSSTGLGILSIASIAIGYLALFALWWFVFRDRSRVRRKEDDGPER